MYQRINIRITSTLSILLLLIVCPSFLFSQSASSVPDMLQKVLPSVVTVGVFKKENTQQAFGFAGSDKADIAYEHLLDISGVQESGSGFIIERDEKKYVVTNAHVVQNASGNDAIDVYTINRTKYPVKIIGGDSFYDIAVLGFTDQQPGSEVATVSFRSDDPRVGESVYAIGTPLGEYPYSVTQGIISAKNRFMGTGLTDRFGYLQSSAPIIWGNSGGPLVSSKGEVTGVNTLIKLQPMGEQTFIISQINFALEPKLAERIINDILTNNGRMRRAFFGLELTQRYQHTGDNEDPGDKIDTSPIIGSVLPNSPAAELFGDKIGASLLKINDVETRNLQEALGALEECTPSQKVLFTLQQGDKEETVSLVAGELKPEQLRQIAGFFFSQHTSNQVAEKENGVFVTSNSTPEKQKLSIAQKYTYNSKDGWYDKILTPNQVQPHPQSQPQVQPQMQENQIGSAGLIVSKDDFSLWRITSLENLGVAVRLAAASGVVDYVPVEAQDQSDVTRIWIGNDENVLVQTVYY